MDIVNETPFATKVLRRDIERGSAFEATLIVKATFERGGDGGFVPAGEQVPIVEERLQTPFGIFHTECFVRKDGVDVCVLGTFRSESPVREALLVLTVEALRSELRVFGPRRWASGSSRLVPTAPEPMTELPIAYSRAYGGVTEHDHESLVWTDNPVGMGYHLSEAGALGRPLPQIEPGKGPPVRAWSDQPPVAGWGPYPLFWGIRAREGIDISEVTAQNPAPHIKARLNNNAHPDLILPQLSPGVDIRIRGMRSADVVVVIPDLKPVAEVTVGDWREWVEARVDGAMLWVDADRLTLTYRGHFRYPYRRGDRRILLLRNAASTKR